MNNNAASPPSFFVWCFCSVTSPVTSGNDDDRKWPRRHGGRQSRACERETESRDACIQMMIDCGSICSFSRDFWSQNAFRIAIIGHYSATRRRDITHKTMATICCSLQSYLLRSHFQTQKAAQMQTIRVL